MSYGCQQDVLRLDGFERSVIEFLCQRANSLTNCAIYALKRSMQQTGKIDFNYPELAGYLKDNFHYKAMFSQAAQHVLMTVCESFKSYSELLSMWFRGELNDKPRAPKYRKKNGLAGISFPSQHLRLNEAIETGLIRLPLGQFLSAEGSVDAIYIPAPANIHPERIREIRIFSRNQCFYIEYVYKKPAEKLPLNPKNALGIDPGVKNWLTCVSTLGDSFIIDGKLPNFWNHTLNREVAKHHKGYWSKKLARMTEKRNRRMRDYINKTCSTIAEYCIQNNIGTVVFGWNPGVKDSISIGSRNNQNFVQLPTAKLKERLKAVLEAIGINFVQTEEANTSKASFLDGDNLPKYGEKPVGWKASGKRIATKLYRTARGWVINADCNAAANIIAKVASSLGISLDKIARGCVTSPRRLSLSMLNRPEFSILR